MPLGYRRPDRFLLAFRFFAPDGARAGPRRGSAPRARRRPSGPPCRGLRASCPSPSGPSSSPSSCGPRAAGSPPGRSCRSRSRCAGGACRRSCAASTRSRGVIERTIASTRFIWLSSMSASASWPMPGHQLHARPGAAPSGEASSGRFRKSSKVNCPLRMPGFHLGGLVLGRRLLGALDQRQDVAHAEDPRGHPLGMEDLERVELLAGRGEHDRAAGDALDRERGAAARVAVELGQDEAVEVDPLLERVRRRRRPAGRSSRRARAAHSVGSGCVADALELVHQLLVDLEAAGGVDDDRVEARLHGRARARRAPPRPDRSCPRGRRERRSARPSCSSWSIAAGRWRSAGISPGLRPLALSWRASFAAVVVLPEP